MGLCHFFFLQRSSRYDDLMIAEEKAKKSSNGLHNKKPSTARRIADISGEKSKQFLPFLQRAGRMQAVVEFVASASRYRLYIPRETCVITFLLSGIQVRPSSILAILYLTGFRVMKQVLKR